jgi:ribonucleotide reductase alpha subunit
MARKVIPARKVWNYILTSQIETGNPYILFKDAINKKTNHPISSQLSIALKKAKLENIKKNSRR